MTATLVYRAGQGKTRKLELTEDVTRIGRKSGNQVTLDHEIVSGTHAEIQRRGDSYILVDLESTNGTFINGGPVRKAKLKDKDRIELGNGGPVLEFREEGGGAGDTPKLQPLSGMWERGMESFSLPHGPTTFGRGADNDVVAGRTPGSVVSSRHAVITVHSEYCEIEDMDSSNGTYVNGRQIRKARLCHGDKVELGSGGPVFELIWRRGIHRGHREAARESERILQKLERASKGGRAGEQTMLFLQAANKYYKRRRWPFLVLSGMVLAASLVTAYLYYEKTSEYRRIRASAEDIFYRMRTIEAQLVRQHDNMPPDEFARLTNERRREEQDYDQFLKNLGVYSGKSPVQKAVMQLARRLGETDLDVPPDFYQTTLSYVEKWRRTTTLKSALDRARQRGLLQLIRTALDQHGLPREFFFIPLQESGYDSRAVGPPTAYGFAKGMWQIIPPTALDYHLRLGPLKDLPQYDQSDQRHDEIASTQAAVRYLGNLYSTKAAASGLLVIASYNYGENRIIKSLDALPN
ncbi:MAG TPA: FHA domain-containing protein, partial [Acidobacteriota bacterium]|nr:FHA domain-containing protein [Acidobacteriota bacterium]